MNMIKKICCIGAGYVGGPTMSVIADKCPEITVEVVDLNKERIAAWNNEDFKKLPVYEPGLDSVVMRARGRNLFFTTNVKNAISSSDIVFISVNTPTKTQGFGSGEASDLKWVEACAREVAINAKGYTIVVEKSTLPVKTAETIKIILNSIKNSSNENEDKSFSVLSNPEFLAEGTAIKDLENPDRVLIGGDNKQAIESLANIYKEWISDEKIIRTNLWSSELSKLAANAFLAQRVSSINSLSAFCEESGANIQEVSKAIGLDSRIGGKFLKSGPGFGGSCFKKDILNLVYLSKSLGLNEVANYWNAVIELNEWQMLRISKIVVSNLFGSVSNKKIGILGFAFKADTNDIRESPAIEICKNLINDGARLNIHDPKVHEDDLNKVLSTPSHEKEDWDIAKNINDVFVDSDAVIILTEWEAYKKIDWDSQVKLMRRPSWIFDTRNLLELKNIDTNKVNIWQTGNGELNIDRIIN